MNTYQQLSINYFCSNSPLSEDLFSLIQSSIEPIFMELGYAVTIHKHDSWGLLPENGNLETSAYKVLKSAFNGEIVLIDASVEGNDNDVEFGNNYECLTPAAMNLDNIIILSRTQLPLNFLPTRSNVSKLGDDTDIVNPDNDTHRGFRKTYSNSQIVCWLMSELKRMHNNTHTGKDYVKYNRLHRDPTYTIDIDKYANSISELIRLQECVFNENEKALKLEKSTHSCSKKCFISYRGRYCSSPYTSVNGKKYTIENVKQAILSQSKTAEVVYFKEGALSNEFMPEVRRWGFVSYIDRVIRECDEFWIFDTKYKEGVESEECGYWDSWWCLGEILTIMRMKYNQQLKPGFRVIVYDPDKEGNDQIRDVDIEKWHRITKEENEELARYYANSDFLEAGYESAANMRRMRGLPNFFQKFIFRRLKKNVFSTFISDGHDDYEFNTFKKSIYSHVYDESFFSGRIYSLYSESPKGLDMNILSDKDFIWKFLNINGWYSNPNNTSGHIVDPYPGAKVVAEDDFSEELLKELHVVKDEQDEFYIWWTPRTGRRTGPNGCVIEKVSLYKNE